MASSSNSLPSWIYVRTDRPNTLWFLYQWLLHSEGLSRFLRENPSTEGGEMGMVDRMVRAHLQFFVEYAQPKEDEIVTERVNFTKTKAFRLIVQEDLDGQESEEPGQRSLILPMNDNEEPANISSDSVHPVPTSVLLLSTCIDSIVHQAPETWALGRNFRAFEETFGQLSSKNLYEFWDIVDTLSEDCEKHCTSRQLWMIVTNNFFHVRAPKITDRTVYIHPRWKMARIVAHFVNGMAQTAKQENPQVIDHLTARYKIAEELYCQVPDYMFPALISAVYSKLGQAIDLFRKTRDNFI